MIEPDLRKFSVHIFQPYLTRDPCLTDVASCMNSCHQEQGHVMHPTCKDEDIKSWCLVLYDVYGCRHQAGLQQVRYAIGFE